MPIYYVRNFRWYTCNVSWFTRVISVYSNSPDQGVQKDKNFCLNNTQSPCQSVFPWLVSKRFPHKPIGQLFWNYTLVIANLIQMYKRGLEFSWEIQDGCLKWSKFKNCLIPVKFAIQWFLGTVDIKLLWGGLEIKDNSSDPSRGQHIEIVQYQRKFV